MSLYSSPPQATHKGAILAIILISYVMIVLDISVVLTGLPKIHQQLGFSEANLAWVQSAYTLGIGGLAFGFIRSAQNGWSDLATIARPVPVQANNTADATDAA